MIIWTVPFWTEVGRLTISLKDFSSLPLGASAVVQTYCVCRVYLGPFMSQALVARKTEANTIFMLCGE